MSSPSKIIEDFNSQQQLLEGFKAKINSLVTDLLYVKKIQPHQITCRVKDRASLEQKIERKKDKYSSLNDITDIVGIRIITYFEDDVDKIASVIESEFEIDKENSIDKRILETDKFGYRSLHYVISINSERMRLSEYEIYQGLKAEIQIRSVLQHAWAEIEHDIGYKGEIEIPRFAKRTFYRIAALLETADSEFVKLKETLKQYEADVAQEIVQKPESVSIDKASFYEYVSESPFVKNLEKQMSESIGIGHVDESLGNLSMYLERISYFPIGSIYELDTELKRYEKWIVGFFKAFNPSVDTKSIPRGLSIFYLAYILATKDENIQKTIDFTKHFFGLTNPEKEAEELMGLFKRIKSEQAR